MDNSIFESTPDIKISVKQTFNIDSDMSVEGFSKKNQFVPELDSAYKFDRDTTLAILAGFVFNKRVLIQGFHGTGKSTHIEQVAARLNWPCIRVNLDSHISRIDLLGKDAIVIKDNKQVTEFREGILPWALQNPVALVFDEYDAGRPDVMFVIQRLLESEGKLTLLDYLKQENELEIILSKCPHLNNAEGKKIAQKMIQVADLTRSGLANGDISTVMSPRTVMTWADNYKIFNDIGYSFRISFLNRCDELERAIIAEYFQRCFAKELTETSASVKINLKNGK